MNVFEKIKNFTRESARVFRVTKKPNKEEYLTVVKVSAIGILVIGLLGFILHILDQLTSLTIVAGVAIISILVLIFWNKKS